MRIGCAQFSPRIGGIDNNLDRADAVVAKARTDLLEDLDLLVLPELAFSGMSFIGRYHLCSGSRILQSDHHLRRSVTYSGMAHCSC